MSGAVFAGGVFFLLLMLAPLLSSMSIWWDQQRHSFDELPWWALPVLVPVVYVLDLFG